MTFVERPLTKGTAALSEFEYLADILFHEVLQVTDSVVGQEFMFVSERRE